MGRNQIRGTNLYLKCHNCGKLLGVRIRRRKNTFEINKGEIKFLENKTVLLVKCVRCHGVSVFERDSPKLGVSGWKYIRLIPPKPQTIKPALYEVDKTYAELYRRRRR